MPKFKKVKTRSISPARTIVLGFLAIISVGTLLLFMPFSAKSGEFTDFFGCLFTALSATCVNGITIYDTYSQWSVFGQSIIMLLIQIGGLGFIAFVTFFNLMLGRKVGLVKTRNAAEEFAMSGVKSVKPLFFRLIAYTFSIEIIGAALLMLTFVPRYGGYGVFMSFFTAVSAFCNAGFDLMGIEGGGVGFSCFADEPLFVVTMMMIVMLGGLSFVVLQDIYECIRHRRRLCLNTKVVLMFTGILFVIGFAVYLVVELTNPDVFGEYSPLTVITTSAFASFGARSAGICIAPLPCANEMSQIFTIIFMFIGAAPGSMGGGIKLTTLAILVATVWSVIRNRNHVELLKHTVSKQVVFKAITVVFLSIVFVLAGFMTVYLSDTSLAANDVLFEVVSAFSTTGFTSGVTVQSDLPARFIIMVIMFIGRIGPVSLVLSLAGNKPPDKSTVLPESDIMVG